MRLGCDVRWCTIASRRVWIWIILEISKHDSIIIMVEGVEHYRFRVKVHIIDLICSPKHRNAGLYCFQSVNTSNSGSNHRKLIHTIICARVLVPLPNKFDQSVSLCRLDYGSNPSDANKLIDGIIICINITTITNHNNWQIFIGLLLIFVTFLL